MTARGGGRRRTQAEHVLRKGGPPALRLPYLPKDVRDALKRASGIHPGLLLQRFLAGKGDGSGKGDVPPIDPRASFERVVRLGQGPLGEAVALMASRATLLRDSLLHRGLSVEERSLSVGWRLTAGLGGGHPAELGFTLHRLGFPYLPGSALKGLAREVAERAVADGAVPAAEVGRLFGEQERQGAARFLDAFPLPQDDTYLELDVMNPQVPDYYQGRDWPREWLDPVPLVFLAVPRGVRFRFLVAAADPAAARRAMDLLVQGLTSWGAGAKGAAGYGWMEPVDGS